MKYALCMQASDCCMPSHALVGVSPGQLAVTRGHLRYCTPASPLAARFSDLAHTSIIDLLQAKHSATQHLWKQKACKPEAWAQSELAPAKATGSQFCHLFHSFTTKVPDCSINTAPLLPHVNLALGQKLPKCLMTCMSDDSEILQPSVWCVAAERTSISGFWTRQRRHV